MGRNTAIKTYQAKSAGQPLELFDPERDRIPIVAELRDSPWIVRASELKSAHGSQATKLAEEPVRVGWDVQRQCPEYFERGRVRYRIQAIVQIWASDRKWWDPRRRVARRYWRVLARGGVYDLAYERETGVWLLVGIQD